jgi:hypothetical protein
MNEPTPQAAMNSSKLWLREREEKQKGFWDVSVDYTFECTNWNAGTLDSATGVWYSGV